MAVAIQSQTRQQIRRGISLSEKRRSIRCGEIDISEANLRELYLEQQLNLREIAISLGLHMATIHYYFKKYGIPRRSKSEARLLLPSKIPHEITDEIVQLYKEGDGQKTIAHKLNISKSVVVWQLRKQGIKMRNISEGLKSAYARDNKNKWMLGKTGELCPNFKGGIHGNGKGYTVILMPEHPSANKEGYILEHRLVWERVHNRPLPIGYHLHHINGIKDDNRPINLLALPKKTHDKLIPELKKRIRQLEEDVKLLEKTLDNSQMIFRYEVN